MVLKLAFLTLGIIFALYPVVWILAAALSPSNSLINQQLIPADASLANFQRLVNNPQHPFLLWMWNSFKVSSITALITVGLCALAAYSFSRFRYRGRRAGLLTILLVQLFPNMLAITALFLLLQQIGNIPGLQWLGLNTLGGLILIYSGGALGFNTWLMKGFFDSVPRELDESALIDGASYTQVFVHIMLPLIRPILAVIAILSFIGTYSDYLIARVMINSTANYTLALGMTLFIRGQFAQQWGAFSAAALVGALPIVVVFLILQNQLIGGLSSGAVKG
jgi:ABC-type maltose transport system permease subunit